MVGVLIRMRLWLLRHTLRGHTRAVMFVSGGAVVLAVAGIGVLVVSTDPAVLLPSSWAAAAVEALVVTARGGWVPVVGALAGATVLVVLLGRRMTTAPSARSRNTRAKAGTGRFLAGLPAGPVGAVAAKEIRTWWRDARRRSALLPSLLVGLALPVMPILAGRTDGLGDIGMMPYAGAVVAAFACLSSGNPYGLDGAALRHTLVMPAAIRADVRGRQLAWLLLVGPVVLLAAGALPAMTRRPDTYPCVLGLVAALLGGGSGLVVLFSVRATFPAPGRRAGSSTTEGVPGRGTGLSQVGMALALALLALPEVGLTLLGRVTGSMPVQWLAVPVGLGIGVLVWWWGGRLAVDRLAERGPELVDTVRTG